MPIPAYMNPQRDFSAGQLDETAVRRDDTPIVRAGASKLSDFESMLAGGVRRRPGTRLRYYGDTDVWRGDIIEPVSGVTFDIELRKAQFRSINEAGTLQTLVAPWTTAQQLANLNWDLFENKLIVVARGKMVPQILTYDNATGLWSIAAFAFDTGTSRMLRQPFYRFAPKGITMQPTTRAEGATGTVTFSAPVLDPLMVGNEFRYWDRRTRLVTYTSPTQGQFLNLQELPPSEEIHMVSVDGFRVGDVITGFETGFEGTVISIDKVNKYLYTLITKNYEGVGAFAGNQEHVLGPDADEQSQPVGSSVFIAPLAIPYWDEAFMTDFRGWPGSVTVDRQRVIFCDFGQLKDAFIESEIGQYLAFQNTGDAEDAIFERVPNGKRVVHVIGGPDQFVFTDAENYYIPISAQNPLTPASIEFREFGTGGCSDVRPVKSQTAIIHISDDGQRLMAVRQTGQVTQPYQPVHLSRYHSQLVNLPVALAVSYGQTVDSGETIYLVNQDGSIISGRYVGGNDWVGFFPWFPGGGGKAVGVATHAQTVIFAVFREMPNAATVLSVETQDYTVTLDCVIEIHNTNGGIQLVPFISGTLHRIIDGAYFGAYEILAGGFMDVDADNAPSSQYGFNYEPAFEPIVPNFDKGQSFRQRLRRRKISQGAITVREAGPFKVGNTDFAGYNAEDSISLPPPLRDKTYTFRVQGRSYDPTVTLAQALPYPLKILEIGMEVTS